MTCDLAEYLLQDVEADSSLLCEEIFDIHMYKTVVTRLFQDSCAYVFFTEMLVIFIYMFIYRW